MRILTTLVILLLTLSTAYATDLNDLANYLAEQNANRPSPFYSDPPPGLFEGIIKSNRADLTNSATAKNDALGWFAMQENARRDTMIQLSAPPIDSRYATSPQWTLYMNQLGQQLNAPRSVQRRYYGK